MTMRVLALVALASCFHTTTFEVGGNVHGMWDGAGGITLRLATDRFQVDLPVAANGAFAFPATPTPGTAYTIEIVTTPTDHTCTVDAPSGVIRDADVKLDVACTGPMVSIQDPAHPEWTFDETLDTQAFASPVFGLTATLTVHAAAGITAQVAGAPIALDTPLPPITPPIGQTPVAVAFTAPHGLGKTFQIVLDRGGAPATQTLFAKSPDAPTQLTFGTAIAVDGDTLAVAADPFAAATEQGGPNPALGSGPFAVYIYVRDHGAWTLQATLASPAAPGDDPRDDFGFSLALSGDTLVVGAPEANLLNDPIEISGGAYVYTRTGTTWTRQGTLAVASGPPFREIGYSVAVSGDWAAIGTPFIPQEKSYGVLYLFHRTGTTWTQAATLQSPIQAPLAMFATALAMAGDTLVVGAPGRQSVFVFRLADQGWTQEAEIDSPAADPATGFGAAVAVSADTLVVGAPTGFRFDAPHVGIDAKPSGTAYVFTRTGATWSQQARLTGSDTGSGDQFGASVALLGDVIAVGAPGESSSAQFVPNTIDDAAAAQSGAAYLFGRTGTTWTQAGYQKASPVHANDRFASSVALATDSLLVGAPFESTGAPNTGALYVFQ